MVVGIAEIDLGHYATDQAQGRVDLSLPLANFDGSELNGLSLRVRFFFLLLVPGHHSIFC